MLLPPCLIACPALNGPLNIRELKVAFGRTHRNKQVSAAQTFNHLPDIDTHSHCRNFVASFFSRYNSGVPVKASLTTLWPSRKERPLAPRPETALSSRTGTVLSLLAPRSRITLPLPAQYHPLSCRSPTLFSLFWFPSQERSPRSSPRDYSSSFRAGPHSRLQRRTSLRLLFQSRPHTSHPGITFSSLPQGPPSDLSPNTARSPPNKVHSRAHSASPRGRGPPSLLANTLFCSLALR